MLFDFLCYYLSITLFKEGNFMNVKGVTKATRKNGDVYYRASITIQSKHIALGNFNSLTLAHKAYNEASAIMRHHKFELQDYNDSFTLSFHKFISLLNYRNHGIYFKTPIYLYKNYFCYYLSPQQFLIFDRDDLFFYANHKIQKRGGYLFICDYGSQYSILSKYGIKPYAKKGVDYIFVNRNEYDFRYENIKIINEYIGVSQIKTNDVPLYKTIIHINGNILIGKYKDKQTAAIAYNKAVDFLQNNGFEKQYIKNYISDLQKERYIEIYNSIKLPNKLFYYIHHFSS